MVCIYNKVKTICRCSLWLCLMVLLPVNAYADFAKYGIYDGVTVTDVGTLYGTWNNSYHGGEYSTSFSGSGTKNDPYQINNEWDLCRLEDQVNAGNDFKGKYFMLMNNLDLAERIWYPIGVRSDRSFAGLFDGNNKTISNMAIVLKDADNQNYYSYGLFGFMRGVIRHLNMTNGYVVIDRTGSNAAVTLMAGLLCGLVATDFSTDDYGAVYECNIQGSIGGSVSNNFNLTYIGGLAGSVTNPVAIYKCKVDVSLTPQDIRHVGGIVGLSSSLPDISKERENTPDTPCLSYLYDCVANVNISADLRFSNALYCGGICGMSDGEILACVSNGTIECELLASSEYEMEEVNMKMGGVTGFNGYDVMCCVSTAQLKGGKTVGGLIGENNNITGPMRGEVLNSVFCGHIDSPNADHTHGLVGNQVSTASVPFNCLFVGTMNGGKNKAPLSDGTTNKCYSDRNMYDDGGEWSCYKYTDEFNDANNSWFATSYNRTVGWLSKSMDKNFINDFSLGYDKWVFKEGFYPYFKVDPTVIAGTTSSSQKDYADYVIATAANYFDDDAEVLSTPSFYGKYAWLSSVPINTPNHNFRTDFVDTPISLAIKQQPTGIGNTMKVATFSVSEDMMAVSGEHNAQTATPKDNVAGDMMLTITSDDNVSRNIHLYIYTRHQWDGVVGKHYDSGDGTSGDPYLIHNARQLMKAFTTNESGEYYKLTKDIWFNENLLTTTGEPSDGCRQWDHESKRDKNHWKAHLDGDGHFIRGLYSNNAFGLVETMEAGASIDNTGFVDCLVWSPESEEMGEGTTDRPLAFLSPSVATGVKIRNCLFDGVLYERRLIGSPNMGGLLHTATSQSSPYVEDCVVAFTSRVKNNYFQPSHALFVTSPDSYMNFPDFAERVLVLNNTLAFQRLVPTAGSMSTIATTNCCYPQGYLKTSKYYNNDSDGKTVEEMTNDTFFSGDGFDKWTVKKGRFPMLKSFAETAYGKLLALPVYTDKDNRFDNMNYLLDFTPGNAAWQSTNNNVLNIDTDIRAMEPKSTNASVYLVRSLDGAKIITPITTDKSITAGIKFKDVETKKFCLAHYDDNNDGEVSLSELKSVTLDEFQADMDENDGNPNDNDGELISLFPEFRYFAGITDLGTSFQDKDKLQILDFSGKITELSDDDFKGNTNMTEITIPTGITTVSGTAFYNSGLENYSVETDHTTFAVADGLLFNKNQDQLVSVPNGRKDASVTIPDHVRTIASKAVYKISALENVYIDAPDYDYETVVGLGENAITAADGKEITYYVEDPTQDYADSDDEEDDPENAPLFRARRTNDQGKQMTPDGKGKGHLVTKYQESPFWINKKIEPFYQLEVSEKSVDAQGRYWATMYIGFDTELPEGLTAYIVDKQKTDENKNTLVLREISNKVRMMTPVVIRANKAGTYKLYPSKEATRYRMYPMSENLLEGVDRNGMQVNQSDANDGGCLTLGKNKSGQMGFFIYKGKSKIPPFRAYLTVNKVGDAHEMLFDEHVEQTTDIKRPSSIPSSNSGEDAYYNLAGQRLQQPSKGVYIYQGKKVKK